jgi:hypothetical protein
MTVLRSRSRLAVSLLALLLMLGACSSGGSDDADTADRDDAADEVDITAPKTTDPDAPDAPDPGEFPTVDPEAKEYGDDPTLDALWDQCEAGSGKACDDLFWLAPLDSEYEQFGYTCGERENVTLCKELDD